MRVEIAYPEALIPWLLVANFLFSSCCFWGPIFGLIALGVSQ